MPRQLPKPPILFRDGTSQAGRLQADLDPAYVSVDERSVKDLLTFARKYAGELKYYNDGNREEGDWSHFLGPDLDLDEAAAFISDPAKFKPEDARRLFPPHRVLFFAFIKLLGYAQQQINTLTRRHLDFYYSQVLGMRKKAAVPDRVNVLLEPAAGLEQVRLPAGTRLSAGADSQGRERIYCTDREIVVNRARIARLSSLYVHKRITGIREAREQHTGPREEGFIKMLEIVLGEPLPVYDRDQIVDYPFLLQLADLLKFASTDLYMPFFELRALVQLKLQRDQSDAEWEEINRLLEKAGRHRTGNNAFKLEPSNPRDFNANFEKAVGVKPDDAAVFGGITEVENIYDLYDKWIRLFRDERQELEQFVRNVLHFDAFDDFQTLIKRKVQIDNEWAEINRILEQAGRLKREDPSYRLVPEDPQDFDPTDFNANLNAAVGPDFSKLPAAADIDEYDAAVQRVEKYFCMSAEHFLYVMTVAEKADAAARDWSQVYDILAVAHKEKVYEDRRQRLKGIREDKGFEAMIRFVLGEDPAKEEAPSLEQLKEFAIKDDDYQFLQKISANPAGAADEDWDRVYRIVEIVQRVRENFPEPVARKEEWRNLYPHEDATSVATLPGETVDKSSTRWKTFGQQQPAAIKSGAPPAAFGWAISSPLLALSEGKRQVALTLGFDAEMFEDEMIAPLLPESDVPSGTDRGPFNVEISTAKGWITPDSIKMEIGNYPALSGVSNAAPSEQSAKAIKFTLNFGPDVDPIEPLPAKQDPIDPSWPVLRLMLRQVWNEDIAQFITPYPPFKNLVLVASHLKVDVGGLAASHIQNDESVLDANKPFEPFGSRPTAGSRFFIGHPELIFKTLETLKFHIEWMGVPAPLKDHYKNYKEIENAANFTVGVSLIDKRLALVINKSVPLFESLVDAQAHRLIEIENLPDALRTEHPGYLYQRVPALPADADLLKWSRYLQWELNGPDFQHEVYPALAARKSIEMAAAIANKTVDGKINAAAYQVNPPYTPKIKSLSLDYSAAQEILLKDYRSGLRIDRIYHIHPFGYNEVQPEDAARNSRGCFFLPQYNNEGELYIGIQNVRPPQNLAILFQLAEGSADPDLKPVPIQWSYLDDNRWISLDEGDILLDSTRGLINSGIIEFDLAPSGPSTRLSRDLYWIRAAVPQHSNSVCDTVALHTQAVSATFIDNNNAPDHYRRPLPAGSISGLTKPLPGIIGVQQPYTSFGGAMEEQDNIFYTRVSERLRHKQRALTLWDYERLVLDRFPQIFKAKCLPADVNEQPEDPGRVEIIVIPDIRNRLPFDPFEPKAPADLIADIQSYLSDRSPAWSKIIVRNAHFVAVKVRIGVRFKPGFNEGYYKELLNKELNRFLSPWAYEEGADIVIGGRIYANSIVNFLDRRDYVEYVAAIKLFQSEDWNSFRPVIPPVDYQGYFVTTDRPDAVLVAARQHEIDIISEFDYEEEKFTGINYMKIELDFIVG